MDIPGLRKSTGAPRLGKPGDALNCLPEDND